MTKMLDVLEKFLTYHGHIYLRLDGTTKVEQRQVHFTSVLLLFRFAFIPFHLSSLSNLVSIHYLLIS